MTFSYSAVWEDTSRLVRANKTELVALAGAFLFLPSLLAGYLLPQPVPPSADRVLSTILEYIVGNWEWLLLANLVNMVGILSMLRIIFGRSGETVAGAIMASFALLPFYFVATVLSNLAIGLGFFFFIIPGLYLFARLVPLAPIMVAEDRRNPIDALRRSFDVTANNGWAVAGLVLIVGIAATILILVLSSILGSILILAAGKDIGGMLALILRALAGAAVSTFMAMLYAAIYRRLATGSAGRGAQ